MYDNEYLKASAKGTARVENEFLRAWDAYISDSDEMFTQEEYLAFKNGWCCAMSYIQTIGRSCWNDAAFPERSK